MTQTPEWTDAESPDWVPGDGSSDFFAIAWRRKWIAFSVTVIALGLGYLYFLEATPVYQSTAQILLLKKEADLPLGAEAQMNYENELSTHILLISSPKIVQQAVEQEGLGALPSLRGVRDVTAAVISGLDAGPPRNSDLADPYVIELQYEGPSSQDCAVVVDAIVSSYQSFLGRSYEKFSRETVELIARAKDELQKQLHEKEKDYEEFRESVELPLIRQGEAAASVHEVRMAEIEEARSEVLVQNTQTKVRIEAIETALKEGGSREALRLLIGNEDREDVEAGPRTRFEEKLFEALLEEQEYLERYGADHPKVKAVRKKMELMQQRLGSLPAAAGDPPVDFLAVYLESLGRELQEGERRLAELNQLFDDEQNAAQKMRRLQLEDEALRNDIARTQQLFDSVVKRLDEMSLLSGSGGKEGTEGAAGEYGGITAEVISPPGAGELVWPRPLVVFGLSGFVGVFLGFGLGYLVELADRSFRSPEDIRRQLGLPVLGHIPVIDVRLRRRRRGEKKVAQTCLEPILCAFHKPKSREAESYRAVRTSLYFSTDGQTQKVIQVTSPNPGDGKTTLCANLAVSIAKSGKRVLLIDADFRRPRIHRYLALDDEVGFSSVIAGDAEIPEAIRETKIENLWAMPCGPKPHNPADLLTSPRLQELLDVVRDQYDFVILDTPPLLAVTDPAVVAPRVDAVFLVIRLTKNARAAATRAAEMLHALGASVLGIVVNGVGKKQGGYGTGYLYGKYRYRGDRYKGYRYGYDYEYAGHNGDGGNGYYSDDSPDERPATKSGKERVD